MATKEWIVAGSVPCEDFPLSFGKWKCEGERLVLRDGSAPPLSIERGTPALYAAAVMTSSVLGGEEISALLVGDTGRGEGSRQLYRDLLVRLCGHSLQGITFHYLFPDVDFHNRILMQIQALEERPLLIADAGFMYAAKMSGYAHDYDLFTPDLGELAFLADEHAPHPFYTRGFLLAEEEDICKLYTRSYAHENAAQWLIIKGHEDCIVFEGEEKAKIASPCVSAMEAIGGTGDLVTGVVTGFLRAGYSMEKATRLGALVCRHAGRLARPTPATQIAEILHFVPLAIEDVLKEEGD